MSKRTVIKIAGESGTIGSAGMIVVKTLKELGFYVYAEREFPSLIKGGRANMQINYSRKPVRSLSKKIDVGIALDREGLLDCLETVKDGGVIINGFEKRQKIIKDLPEIVEKKQFKVVEIPARDIALENGGNVIMVNTVLLGFLWQVLDLDLEILKDQIGKQFLKKPALIPINYLCATAGYNFQSSISHKDLQAAADVTFTDKVELKPENTMIIDGNSAIVLGAVLAGVRNYFGYPMSPSSSILVYIAEIADKHNILVKQVEDEITASQMTLGSMQMGTRSLTATSGGGFDLMTETISLSGMIEVPLVVVIAQRPGPATGLPTWTGQGDLDLAVFSGHGEYAKLVIGVADPDTAFIEIQKAFNYAEKYQIPVIVLTEANIAMSVATTPAFTQNEISIDRYITVDKSYLEDENETQFVKLTEKQMQEQSYEIVDNLESTDGYKITESGLSKRWLPGTSKTVYFANGDEHDEMGSVMENADITEKMIQKRIKKLDTIKQELPDATLYSSKLNSKAKTLIIGWGSTLNTALDAQLVLDEKNEAVDYLHYTYLFPLKTDKLKEIYQNCDKVILFEGNYYGQLGRMLEAETGLKFTDKVLKWNGRPFYVEEIVDFVL